MGNDRRRRQVTGDELLLWRQVMRDVTPFPGRLTPSDEPAATPIPPEPPPTVSSVVRLMPAAVPAPRAQPILEHGRTPNIDKRTAERMRGGEMAIDGSIDLHGMTQDLAHLALTRYVTVSSEIGRRCLLIITGKGRREGAGVLRAQVPRWLNEPALRPLVLAFAYARPKHGGEGALYVLLKRRR
jgi:DNA-nicking Smr family endonuclease